MWRRQKQLAGLSVPLVKTEENLSGKIPFFQISQVEIADLSPMASGSFCLALYIGKEFITDIS